MAETLPITGQDVKLELLLDGFPQKVVDQVTNFTERPRYQTTEHRPLGGGTSFNKIPDGWEGTLEIARQSSQLDDFIDAVNLAHRNRVPYEITITNQKFYLDGTSSFHVYPTCKVDFSTTGQRGQNVSTTLQWTTGKERI
jgi:hypothetical protein